MPASMLEFDHSPRAGTSRNTINSLLEGDN